MRESQQIYAWDDGNMIYLLDGKGSPIAQRQVPKPLHAVRAAETGEWLVALGRSGEMWWFDAELNPQLQIACTLFPLALAVDPLGRFAVVSSTNCKNVIFSRTGKRVAEFTTTQALKYLGFVPESGSIIGAAENGLVTCHDFKGKTKWNSSPLSNVGALAVTGSGEVMLACFGYGILCYDADGSELGSLHHEHSPNLLATDYDGTKILTTSLENFLTEQSPSGRVRADRPLPEAPVSLTLDALGRYGVLGYRGGKIELFMLPEFFDSIDEAPVAESIVGSGGAIASSGPEPRIKNSSFILHPSAFEIEEARTAILDVVPGTSNLALLTDKKTLRIYDTEGELLHETEHLRGRGLTLSLADRWLVAASDTNLIAYDPVANESVFSSLTASEVSHLEPGSDFGNTLLVEMCKDVCRFQFPGEKIWSHWMNRRVESAAIHPSGEAAVALEDGELLIYDADGETIGNHRFRRSEPVQVVGRADGWVSMARGERMIRGHELKGSVLWSTPTPWSPWMCHRVGEFLVIASEQGQSMLLSGSGEVLAKSRDARPGARYFLRDQETLMRIFQAEETLIVTSLEVLAEPIMLRENDEERLNVPPLEGQPLWRYTSEQPIGPFAACQWGVWVFLDRRLAFFSFD